MERETVKKKMMEAFHKRPFSEPLDKYRTELQFIEHMTNAAMGMMEEQEFEIWKEGYKARYAERWGVTVARESDLITLYRKWKNERTGNANPSLP